MADTLATLPTFSLFAYIQDAFKQLHCFLAQQKFLYSTKLLRSKIQMGWNNNAHIQQFALLRHTSVSLHKHQHICFGVKMIGSGKSDKPKEKEGNPFAEEKCRDKYIDELSNTHALIYNKYPMVPFHVLIITKEFESQMAPITAGDFHASLKVMSSMDYFVFFNGGPNAGASQKHKHLQAILSSSFPGGLPLNLLVKESKLKGEIQNDIQYTRVEAFKFAHVLCKFRDMTAGLSEENVRSRSKQLETVYLECLKRLGNSKLTLAYNMVLTREWMFVVLRKGEVALNLIRVNALGFAGSFAVRSEVEYEFVQSTDPIEILNSITFPI